MLYYVYDVRNVIDVQRSMVCLAGLAHTGVSSTSPCASKISGMTKNAYGHTKRDIQDVAVTHACPALVTLYRPGTHRGLFDESRRAYDHDIM